MKRKAGIPTFRSDRQAADFWAANDSTSYVRGLKETRVKVAPSLRRRVVTRAKAKKAVTLRLEQYQIARAKQVARRKSIPYQTLLRMWIAEGLGREQAG